MVKNLLANAGDIRDLGLIPGSGRSSGTGLATHSSVLPGKFHGQKSLAGNSPGGPNELEASEHMSCLTLLQPHAL